MSDLGRVGDDLAAVLKRLGLASPSAAGRVTAEWAEIAGEPWASTARPAGIHAGVLRVEVADGSDATLLRFHSNELVERIAEAVGRGVVTSVRISVARRGNGL